MVQAEDEADMTRMGAGWGQWAEKVRSASGMTWRQSQQDW